MTDINNIDAIIFDLGGVIIGLDPNATINAFAQLSSKTSAAIENLYESAPLFKQYEIGAMSDSAFRDGIRHLLSIECEDELIDAAWNAMLLGISQERLDAMEMLKAHCQLFVMSNTNHIHIEKFDQILAGVNNLKTFKDYFDKVYFSHELGARKPHATAFTPIINEYNLDPTKTLFIDDRADNIQAASALGLKTFQNVGLNDWLKLIEGINF